MTGYGKAVVKTDNIQAVIEIRSLNSKNADVNIRVPSLLKEKEIEIKQLLTKLLERGKIDCTINIEYIGSQLPGNINEALVKAYFSQIKNIAGDLNIETGELTLQSILRFPEIFSNTTESISETEWNEILSGLNLAIENINKFRTQEGENLYKDFVKRIENISNTLQFIEKVEPQRIENIKNRIQNNLEELFADNQHIDKNRFEQELIYYIEKIDITEEKVRLKNHLNYFIETLNNNQANGKKLGFISQEIGREINTLGSKANNADIQHYVVQMKDELEKIKEQILNIL